MSRLGYLPDARLNRAPKRRTRLRMECFGVAGSAVATATSRAPDYVLLVIPLTPEPSCDFVGAGRGAGLTHHIRVPGPASVAGRISVGARVGYCHDHCVIPVNVDVG